jgi:uncharacterized protein with HEPN domain
MSRDYRLYLDDILEAIKQIRSYIEGLDEKSFVNNRKTQDAVVRNLEIIGEAAKSLPDSFKGVASEIDWRKITGMRNILVHEYFGINLPIIWDVVQNKLDLLEAACQKLFKALPLNYEGRDPHAPSRS